MEALLSVGGSIASAVMDKLVSQVSSDAIQQFGRQSRLQGELWKLKNALVRTRAILNRAEKGRTKDENLAQILPELKDAAYDAEDLLDEFEYQVLQQKIESQKNQGGNFLSSTFGLARKLFNRDDDAVDRVREIMGRLDSIADEMERVIRLLDLNDEGEIYKTSVRRETSSFLTEPEVFGREEEKEKVIKLLLKSSEAAEPRDDDLVRVCSKRPKKDSVSVLPVVGIGGIGKTTFAQLIYNDQKVHSYFNLKIWVCVSDNFDVKRLTKEIIESVTREKPSDHQNLNCLQEILKEKITSKRFLLVLDDIWNDDGNKWDCLCAPLRAGLEGSKILLTTRSRKVAVMMGTMKAVFLEGLANDAYWEFFSKHAFGSQNPEEEHPELEAIGKKIADRLKGSPLAAKTLGGLLNSDLDERHWRTILNSEIWELKQREDDIIPVLRLSYQYLPAYLKQCITYCSMFPKDYEYEKDELVQHWMAQGFIVPQGNMPMEEVGSGYFDDLLSRSFFQPFRLSFSHCLWKMKHEYVMHDLIHDLVRSVSIDEDGQWQKTPSRFQHLSIYTKNLEPSKLLDWVNYKNLRTLVFVNIYHTNFVSMLDCLFTVPTKIRVLQLRKCGVEELPESIGKLKHLRYLDVSSTNIRRLPESLCGLYNLLVLNIWNCPIEYFPTRMTNFVKLRQFIADKQTICKLANIGKLTSLQELPKFRVVKQRGHKIEELKHITQLHGRLRIESLESVESKQEASEAKLHDKHCLDELELVWNSSGKDDEVLEGLKPNSNLRRLEIRNYGGVRFPSWLGQQSLKSLKAICLENIQSCDQLPSLGQLPFLKVLYIKNMHAVKLVGHKFYGSPEVKGFPSLEELRISDMLEWEEWSGTEGIQMFPRLLKLIIKDCPKLKGLACLPPSLRYLDLENVGINMLPESGDGDQDLNDDSRMTKRSRSSSRTSSIYDMSMLGCPNLVNLEQWLLLHHLPDIRRLSIINCQQVVRLPMERFKDFLSLEFLRIENCPLLPSPEQLMLPSSLKALELDYCGHLDESLYGCPHNLTSLTRLELHHCPHITSLPGEVLRHMIAVRYLTLWDCGELRSLGGLRALRTLEYLTIIRCPRLMESANEEEQGEGLAHLHSLHIDDTALVKVLFSTITLPSLHVLEIRDSTQLILFAGEEQLWLQSLESLRTLYLVDCTKLQSLPMELHSLSTLQFLVISNCPEIRSVPEKGLPSSLTSLQFKDCHPMLTEQLEIIQKEMRGKLHNMIS